MPNLQDATHWQRAVVDQVERSLGIEPVYTGSADDCYKFQSTTIFGYVKLFAAKTRSTPPGGIKVIVEEKFWSQIRDDLQQGNDWYGKPSRHRLIEADDPRAAEVAADLLAQARQNLAKSG